MLLDGDEIEITYNVSTKQGGYAQDLGSWETATFIVTGRTGVVGWDITIPGANIAVTCSITTDGGSQKSDKMLAIQITGTKFMYTQIQVIMELQMVK